MSSWSYYAEPSNGVVERNAVVMLRGKKHLPRWRPRVWCFQVDKAPAWCGIQWGEFDAWGFFALEASFSLLLLFFLESLCFQLNLPPSLPKAIYPFWLLKAASDFGNWLFSFFFSKISTPILVMYLFWIPAHTFSNEKHPSLGDWNKSCWKLDRAAYRSNLLVSFFGFHQLPRYGCWMLQLLPFGKLHLYVQLCYNVCKRRTLLKEAGPFMWSWVCVW